MSITKELEAILTKNNFKSYGTQSFYIDPNALTYPVLCKAPDGEVIYTAEIILVECTEYRLLYGNLTFFQGRIPSECGSYYKSYTFVYPDELEKSIKSQEQRNVSTSSSSPACFVATATFGTPYEVEVIRYRNFRDQYLSQSILGKVFIKVYYRWLGPSLAKVISSNQHIKKVSAAILGQLVNLLPHDC